MENVAIKFRCGFIVIFREAPEFEDH
jgi:hypothetical protein